MSYPWGVLATPNEAAATASTAIAVSSPHPVLKVPPPIPPTQQAKQLTTESVSFVSPATTKISTWFPRGQIDEPHLKRLRTKQNGCDV